MVDNLKKIPVELQGLHERNPVNVPRFAGVQIELPPRARGVGPFWADHQGDALVPHTRSLIDGLVAAVGDWTARPTAAIVSAALIVAYRRARARRPGADRGADHARAARAGDATRRAGDAAAVDHRRADAGARSRRSWSAPSGVRRGGRPGSCSRGTVPDEWSGHRVEAIIDLGFRADPPGFQCEATGRRRSTAGRCRASTRAARATPSTPRPGR